MVIAQIAVDPMDHFFSDPIFSSFFDKPFWQVFRRQHCRLSICENWLSWTNSIRTKDPNNHSDTETGTLSNFWLTQCS